MIHLKVKLDCLQQNSFQGHHLLSRILLKSAELSIIGQTPDSLDQILALLRGFLSLASQEQNTGSSDISWKLLEAMFHVESVKVNRCCGHRVMAQAKGFAHLLDEPCTLSPISSLCLEIKTSEIGGSFLQIALLIIPHWHLGSTTGQQEPGASEAQLLLGCSINNSLL